MPKSTRSTLQSELHDTKQALMASERRAKRAVKRLRDIEKALEPLLPRIHFWARSPLPPESNAAKLCTVGECRQLESLLAHDDDVDDASDASLAREEQECA